MTCGHTYCGDCIGEYCSAVKAEEYGGEILLWVPEDNFTLDQSYLARHSTSGLWDTENERLETRRINIFAARAHTLARVNYWRNDCGYNPRFSCPECQQIFSTRPTRNVALNNLADEYRRRFGPTDPIPPADWDDDAPWCLFFPQLMTCNAGEFCVSEYV